MPIIVMFTRLAALVAHITFYFSAKSKGSVFSRSSMLPATCIAFSFAIHYLSLPIAAKNAIVTQISAVITTAVQFISFLLTNSCDRWATSMLFSLVRLNNLHQSTSIRTAVDRISLVFHFLLAPTLSSCYAALHGVLCTHQLDFNPRVPCGTRR